MMRLAMWSGPRNISTAMMRSWGNRSDVFVCDEPLYAYFLATTSKPHPGANEVIDCHERDWRKVVDWLTTHKLPGKAIFFQKQMSHHLLPQIDRQWLGKLTNCFLIRHPREVICSYLKKNPGNVRLEDLGFPQLAEIFALVHEQQRTAPPVVDAKDVLENPRRILGLLCERLNVPFAEEMLFWPPGPRPTDGVWAKYWYHEVIHTTSFQPYVAKNESVPSNLQPIYEKGIEYYEQLYQHRIK